MDRISQLIDKIRVRLGAGDASAAVNCGAVSTSIALEISLYSGASFNNFDN
jgi:hypothetical protein